jgi:folate-dependent phosphoribosylglycinamide formyltransferase PurN
MHMTLTPLFDPQLARRAMRVAAFMSGSGTNVTRLIDRQKQLEKTPGGSPFTIIFIFSDRSDGVSRGEKIALDAGIPYFSYDIRQFHKLRGIKRTVASAEGMEARKEFDSVAARLIKAFEIDVIVLAGYMSYVTLTRCINVHPADLSILTPEGKRRFVGDHAVADAIASGESSLRASTIWTDTGVDTGPLLMVSRPVKVALPLPLPDLLKDQPTLNKAVDHYQSRLKEVGDWQILPLTVEMMARGRFSLDEYNNLHVDERPAPKGYRLEA